MKKIPKKPFDEIIDMTRYYWANGGDDAFLQNRIDKAMSIECVGWLPVMDLMDSILNPHGFCPDAENDEIYCALRCLGWEVSGEVEASESL